MTENTTETRTVQAYRHDARDVLTAARESLSVRDVTRNEHTKRVYDLLNGSISSILQGKVGLSQEAQVEHLDRALTTTTENREQVAEAVAAAKAEILAKVTEALEGWDEKIIGEADKAIAILTEAKEFAATRDFDQWQKDKARRRKLGGQYSEDDDPDGEDADSDPDEEPDPDDES